MVRVQQWDGQKWVVASDWISPMKDYVRDMVEKSAAKFAKEKGIKLRDCSKVD